MFFLLFPACSRILVYSSATFDHLATGSAPAWGIYNLQVGTITGQPWYKHEMPTNPFTVWGYSGYYWVIGYPAGTLGTYVAYASRGSETEPSKTTNTWAIRKATGSFQTGVSDFSIDCLGIYLHV